MVRAVCPAMSGRAHKDAGAPRAEDAERKKRYITPVCQGTHLPTSQACSETRSCLLRADLDAVCCVLDDATQRRHRAPPGRGKVR